MYMYMLHNMYMYIYIYIYYVPEIAWPLLFISRSIFKKYPVWSMWETDFEGCRQWGADAQCHSFEPFDIYIITFVLMICAEAFFVPRPPLLRNKNQGFGTIKGARASPASP